MTSIKVKTKRRELKASLLAVFSFMLCAFSIPQVQAQSFSEWFFQTKTQKKYLLNQIAALQVYIGYARKGYDIAGSGLRTVRDITNGEFNLHELFFTGLKQVGPAIRNDARIAEIIALQLSISKAFGAIKQNEVFSADQFSYISDVAEGVMHACYTDLEELLLVITSGKLEMTDDERLGRLNGIYARMLDKSAFTQQFCGDAALLIRQKEAEQSTIQHLRRYYEID